MAQIYLRLSESSTACFDSIKPKPLKLGKYTICPDHKLGKGSFSTVFLCQDANGNKAAVKILNKHSKNSEHIAKLQKAQAKILKKLKHPNIVGYFGTFQSTNNYYLLFQYCDGKTLREFLNNHKAYESLNANNIAIQIIEAMCYLNEKKIMHRDIKPDNIKYFKGKCTLIDFGFACEFNDKLKMKESVGTPSYMSPELLQHQTYNEMSDIWSLGITLYQIIYGKLPWFGRSQHQLYSNIMRNPLKFAIQPVISTKMKKLIEGCLQKKCSDRTTFQELKQFKCRQSISYVGQKPSIKSDCNFLCW